MSNRKVLSFMVVVVVVNQEMMLMMMMAPKRIKLGSATNQPRSFIARENGK